MGLFGGISTRVRHASRDGSGSGNGGDRAVSVIEYAAVIVLAAAILAVLVFALPGSLTEGVQSAVCRLLMLDTKCQEGGEAEKPIDYTPPYCPKTVDRRSAGFRVDIGFVSIGEDFTFVREDLANGVVLVTMVPRAEIGAGTGAGIDFGKRDGLQVSGGVEASAKARLASGNTFIFKNQDEFKQFEEQLNNYANKKMMEMSPDYNALGALAVEVAQGKSVDDFREPDVQTGTFELEGEIKGGIGVWTSDPKKKGEKTDGGLNLNLGADGNATVNSKWDFSRWRNGDTAETYTYTSTGSLGANIPTQYIGGEQSYSGGTRVQRDKDGRLLNIRYTTVRTLATKKGEGGQGADGNTDNNNGNENGGGFKDGEQDVERSTQMVQLDFKTEEERAMGEELLRERGILPPRTVLNYMGDTDKDGRVPVTTINDKPLSEAPDWEQFAFEKGLVWQFDSDDKIEETEINASIKMGLQFGLSANWATEQRRTSEAKVLDAPKGDRREFIDYPQCVAGN